MEYIKNALLFCIIMFMYIMIKRDMDKVPAPARRSPKPNSKY